MTPTEPNPTDVVTEVHEQPVVEADNLGQEEIDSAEVTELDETLSVVDNSQQDVTTKELESLPAIWHSALEEPSEENVEMPLAAFSSELTTQSVQGFVATQRPLRGNAPISSIFDHSNTRYVYDQKFQGLHGNRLTGRMTAANCSTHGLNCYDGHDGVDFAVPAGTNVYPVAKGTVITSYKHWCAGHWISVQHANGFITDYVHLQSRNYSRGQVISDLNRPLGRVGAPAHSNCGAGAHLHFVLRKGSKYMNPFGYWGTANRDHYTGTRYNPMFKSGSLTVSETSTGFQKFVRSAWWKGTESNGNKYWYTLSERSANYRDGRPSTNHAIWWTDINTSGSYKVQVYIPKVSGSIANQVTYKVAHKGGFTNRSVNQDRYKGRWVNLGTFNFDRNHVAGVMLGDNSTGTLNRKIVFDKVRWVKVGGTTPTPTRPARPTTLSPGTTSTSGTSVNTLTPTLTWRAVTGATKYQVWISKYPYTTLVYSNTNVTGTSIRVPTGKLSAGTKYRWNMRACNSAGCSSYSARRYFTPTSGVTRPARPSTISPGTTSSAGTRINTNTPALSWHRVNGATKYQVWISKYPYRTIVYSNTNVTGTSVRVPVGKLIAGTKYRWNMRACNSVGCSSYSVRRYFTTPSGGSASMYGKMLVRSQNYALNGYSPYNGRELTVWTYDRADKDQFWDLLAPGTFGGNKGWMIRRKGTNHCVNVHYLGNYKPVNLWRCSGSDPDQQFDMLSAGSYKMFRRKGTNYCLNAAEKRNYGKVTIWTCNSGDADQKFLIR